MSHWKPEDKAWLKARRAQWKMLANTLRRLYKAYELKELEPWYLRGGEPPDYIAGWLLVGLHPSEDIEALRAFIYQFCGYDGVCFSEYYPPLTGYDFLEMCHHGFLENDEIYGPHGILDGREELVIKTLMPERFTNAEQKFGRGPALSRVFPYKAEIFCRQFLDCTMTFFFYPACNPYQPWQYMLQAWLDCLHEPELAEKDWVDGTERLEPQLRQMFRFIQRFVEPRPTGTDSPPSTVKRFVDNFVNSVDLNSLPPKVRAAWDFVQTPEGRLEHRIHHDGILFQDCPLPQRTLHGLEPNDDAFEAMAAIYHRLGFSDDSFSAQGIKSIDFGPRTSLGFAMDLGYGDVGKIDYTKDSSTCFIGEIPAREYRIRVNDKFLEMAVNDQNWIDICIVIPQRAPGCTVYEHMPWLVMYAEYGPHYDSFRPPHEAQLHERLVRSIWNAERPERWLSYSPQNGMSSSPIGVDMMGVDCYRSNYGYKHNPLYFGNEDDVFDGKEGADPVLYDKYWHAG